MHAAVSPSSVSSVTFPGRQSVRLIGRTRALSDRLAVAKVPSVLSLPDTLNLPGLASSRLFSLSAREGIARLKPHKLQPTAACPGVAARRCSYLANNVASSQHMAMTKRKVINVTAPQGKMSYASLCEAARGEERLLKGPWGRALRRFAKTTGSDC